jgi:hypothetical protein
MFYAKGIAYFYALIPFYCSLVLLAMQKYRSSEQSARPNSPKDYTNLDHPLSWMYVRPVNTRLATFKAR